MEDNSKAWTKTSNPAIKQVVTHPIHIPSERCSCGTIHLMARGVIDLYDNFWFNCRCGSTLFIPKEKR